MPARVYAVANQKGGVGKTTTAVNVGACLAEAGERVLLIDLDPQANATSGLGMRANGSSTHDLLDGVPLEGLAKPSPFPNLDVVMAKSDLAAAAVQLWSREGGERYLGEVSAISPEVQNGQVTGRIRFGERKPAGLRQNQQLTTRILMDEHPDVLIVERGPFVDTGAGRVAYVVRDGTAERTAIQIGATSLNSVEIVSGVKEGDRIVISGTDQFDGAQRVALN